MGVSASDTQALSPQQHILTLPDDSIAVQISGPAQMLVWRKTVQAF